MLWVGGHILLVGADELGWHAPYDFVHDLEKKLELNDMVWGERVIFVLSGVTDGLLVRGIEDTPEGLEIQSFLLDSELDEGHILDVRVEREN